MKKARGIRNEQEGIIIGKVKNVIMKLKTRMQLLSWWRIFFKNIPVFIRMMFTFTSARRLGKHSVLNGHKLVCLNSSTYYVSLDFEPF